MNPAQPVLRWPCLAVAFSLCACGSRTQLDADGILDNDVPGAPDAGVLADCFVGSRRIGETPIDLYFALDKSRSMATIDRGSTTTRWEAVAAATEAFIDAPLSAGLGVGMGFFPRVTPDGGALCSTPDYAFPVVPIGILPGVAPSIVTAISLQQLSSGGTPTTPALDGAHVYARARQSSQPSHAVAVVLVTDGLPRGCNNTVASTSTVAGLAAVATPPIKTYVLGVGPNLDNLNAIAHAGGTTQAYLVESSGEAALLAALEAIRTSALTCEYALPLTPAQTPRLDVVKVSTRTADGAPPVEVGQVENAEACAGGAGWFYDNSVSTGDRAPTRITLCPASCSPLVRGTGNALDVAFGCLPAPSAPPPRP